MKTFQDKKERDLGHIFVTASQLAWPSSATLGSAVSSVYSITRSALVTGKEEKNSEEKKD
jgi:hypothetical protein